MYQLFSVPEIRTDEEDTDQEQGRRFITAVCDGSQESVVDLLCNLEACDPVQVEVSEELLDRFEEALKTAAITIQPIIDNVNTLCVYVNKLLAQSISLPNRPLSNPDTTYPTPTTTQPTPPGPSLGNSLTDQLRARARMKTINELFAGGINPDDLMPMERRVIFTDDMKNISFDNIERICQFIRREKPKNPAPTTNVAKKLDGTKAPLMLLPEKPKNLPDALRLLPPTVDRL